MISVVALASAGAVARSLWLAPLVQTRASGRTAHWLEQEGKLREGDILFQTSKSRQSRAVQEATKSPWSHCGMLVRRKGAWMVFEAVQPVKVTPLADWIGRGKDGRFALKRLRQSVHSLSGADLAKMEMVGRSFVGKPYDALFGWGDDRIYCSELVWKVYRRALGVEVGAVQKLGEFDLSAPSVKLILEERYGKAIPKGDTVISPEAMYRSQSLETVYESH